MQLTSLVDADFNPVIIEGFLSGVYLLLFVQAIWKLVKTRAHGPYIIALILLWMSCSSSFIFDWLRARNAFVLHSNSPTSILRAFNAFSNRSPFIVVIMSNVISDCILIWRCHVLWKSKRILAILMTVLVASVVFNVLVLVLPPSSVQVALLSVALGTLLSVAMTVFATLLIALKIILVTREARGHYSYTKVIEILVESAAMESVVLLLNGVINIIGFENPTATVVLLEAYTGILRRTVVGIAPTLIAFRVADEKQRTEVNNIGRSGPGSHLAFKHSTGTHTAAQRTWVSTLRFQTARREDDCTNVRSRTDLEDGISRRESTEKVMDMGGPDLAYRV